MIGQVLQFEPIAVGYWAPFAVAAIACFGTIGRARQIEAAAVSRGLVWLLGTTGVWAALKVAYFLFPAPLREPAYTVGLIFGFATVWVWLYFCSAYTGRSFHRNEGIRRVSAGVFLSVVLVKLTNPLHGRYFETAQATEPFDYLAIQHGVFHWTVTGLSYVLAGVGLFMLFDLYTESGYETRPLSVLTVLLGLPVLLDIFAVVSGQLIDVIYAPLGVAAFALGVLYVYERRFLAVQSSAENDDAVIFLDTEGQIRDYTPAAAEFFPALTDAVGSSLSTVLPEVAAVVDSENQILKSEQDGERRYLLTTTSTITLGEAEGELLVFSDVTSAERRRRELARHNQQLEGFATALAHELRNMLQIIEWRLGLVAERTEEGTVTAESIQKADAANERLSDLVDDFTVLAKYGQTVEHVDTVAVVDAVEDAWSVTDTGEMELLTDSEGSIEANPGRLRELLTNVFEFARLNDAQQVRVELLDDGFAIEDDGNPPGDDTAGYLAFGESVPNAEAGMKLPSAQTFARAHGWELEIDERYTEGVRLVVSGITTEQTVSQPMASE